MGKSRKKLSSTAKVGLGALAGLVVLLGAGYLAGHFLAGENLPRNAAVNGVPIGGLTPAQAEAKLRAELSGPASAELTITAGGQTVHRAPDAAGLAVDYQACVANAGGGRSWHPLTILNVLFGGSDQPATLSVDEARLSAAIADLAAKTDQPPVDAAVTYTGLKPVRSEAAAGRVLDRAAAASAVRDAYLNQTSIKLPLAKAEPAITTAEADQVVAGLAAAAVSAPTEVLVGEAGRIRLEPEQIAASLRFRAVDGALVAGFDSAALDRQVAPALARLGLKQPKDATFTIRQGKPVVVPAVDGVGVDPAGLARELVPVLDDPAPRRVSVPVSPRAAAFTAAEAEQLGVKEVTGKFTTYFPGTAYRYNNIGKAAKLINGTFLKPGETFSMNQTLGERTVANGWMSGGAIDGGKIVERLGGGISQATTTTFNAIFFAGLEDIYHKPHSLYFSRYPVGREATLDWVSVDMKFRNDSPYGVVLQSWITGRPGTTGSITVKVWSTKRYTIKSSPPIRSNYRPPGKTVYDDSKDCIPQSAMTGFDVRFNRLFYQGKKLVRTEPFKWSYHSLTPVVCGKKPGS